MKIITLVDTINSAIILRPPPILLYSPRKIEEIKLTIEVTVTMKTILITSLESLTALIVTLRILRANITAIASRIPM